VDLGGVYIQEVNRPSLSLSTAGVIILADQGDEGQSKLK
jgi:hypothetical protein